MHVGLKACSSAQYTSTYLLTLLYLLPSASACVLCIATWACATPATPTHLATQQQAAGAEGWRGTSLEPYIAAFASSFLSPLAASSKAALNERAQAAAAEQRTQRADVSW